MKLRLQLSGSARGRLPAVDSASAFYLLNGDNVKRGFLNNIFEKSYLLLAVYSVMDTTLGPLAYTDFDSQNLQGKNNCSFVTDKETGFQRHWVARLSLPSQQ